MLKNSILILVLFYCCFGFTAVSTSTVWEIRSSATGGANVNGCGFVTGATGTDYSQQNGAQYALTGLTSAGAGNTILYSSASADMVGNIAHAISGTNVTPGWFEITSVSVGVSITFSTDQSGASIALGVVANGVLNIGGACSLGSSDDAVFENSQPLNKWYVKLGTYATNGTISIAAAGGTQTPIQLIGYNSTRGDNPTGSSRPTFNIAATTMTFGTSWEISNMIFTGTAAVGVSAGVNGKQINSKFINTSTTTGRSAIRIGKDGLFLNNEAISYRGIAVDIINTVNGTIFGNYIHDSDVGISDNNTSLVTDIENNIIADNVSSAIHFTAAKTGATVIKGNTIYGNESKLGNGVKILTGGTNFKFINNIFYGLSTAVLHADATQATSYENYNDFFNNTTNRTGITAGTNSIALTPSFKSVSQISGSTATVSGAVLTQSGGDFSGVTDSTDFIYIVSGTNATVGKYLIVSHSNTTVATDINIGNSATADKVWNTTIGHNFAPGINVKAVGFPGSFSGSSTTGYMDIGGAQRREPKPARTN